MIIFVYASYLKVGINDKYKLFGVDHLVSMASIEHGANQQDHRHKRPQPPHPFILGGKLH